MVLSIFSKFGEWINEAVDFVEKNWTSPWFWLITFIALLALGLLIISKFADN